MRIYGITQFSCGTTGSNPSNFGGGIRLTRGVTLCRPQISSWMTFLLPLDQYLPLPTDHVREIKIKLWVMQNTASNPLNFTNNATHLAYLNQVVNIANGILAELWAPVQDQISAHPNPSHDQVIFQLNTTYEPTVGRIQVYDGQKRLVYERALAEGENQVIWQPAAHLPGGIYFYRYINAEKIGTARKLLLLH